MYKKKNFAKSLTTNNPLAIGGTSLGIVSGEGVKFPAVGAGNLFMGVIWGIAYGSPEADATREIVKCYQSADDTFTIVRAQEDTSAKEWPTGSNFMLTATAGVFDEYDASLATETTTPGDTDLFGTWISGVLKKLTFLNLKNAITSWNNPIGTVREFNVSTNPGTLLGIGTWSAYGTGRVTVAIDAGQTEFDAVDETGGAKTHTLTLSQIPNVTGSMVWHNSSFTNLGGLGGCFTTMGTFSQYSSPPLVGTATSHQGAYFSLGGGGLSHNNLQPYIVVYRWVRTA